MNKFFITLFLGLFLFMPVTFASEQIFSEAEKAGQLYAFCKAADGVEYQESDFTNLNEVEDRKKLSKIVLCLSYIKGFYYGVVAQEMFVEDDFKKTCVSDYSIHNALELRDSFIRFVDEKPERKKQLSIVVLHKALIKNYACKK